MDVARLTKILSCTARQHIFVCVFSNFFSCKKCNFIFTKFFVEFPYWLMIDEFVFLCNSFYSNCITIYNIYLSGIDSDEALCTRFFFGSVLFSMVYSQVSSFLQDLFDVKPFSSFIKNYYSFYFLCVLLKISLAHTSDPSLCYIVIVVQLKNFRLWHPDHLYIFCVLV